MTQRKIFSLIFILMLFADTLLTVTLFLEIKGERKVVYQGGF